MALFDIFDKAENIVNKGGKKKESSKIPSSTSLKRDIVAEDTKNDFTSLFEEVVKKPYYRPSKKFIDTIELRETLDRIFKDENCELITNEEGLKRFLEKSDIFGLDTETSGLYWYKDEIAGFSIGTATESAYIPLNHRQGTNYEGSRDNLVSLLLTKKYLGFNAKFDLLFLTAFDSRLADLDFIGDGYLAIRVYNNTYEKALKKAYRAYIDTGYEEYNFNSLFKIPYIEYNPEDVYKYGAVDARKHFVVERHFEKLLKSIPSLYKLYTKLEVPLLKVVAEMEKRGIKMDTDYIKELKEGLVSKQLPILERILEITNPTFNPASPKQVKDEFKNRGIRLTSTGEAELSKLKDKEELASLILDYRQVSKSINTFTDSLLDYTNEEKGERIAHPVFNQYGADTGRFSSSSFNVQQIPREDCFRKMFVARPNMKLISVDYSQQEVRVLAALSKEALMLKAFNEGKDFYSMMGATIYDLEYESCLKNGKNGHIRNEMKSVVLGMNYDMQAKTLAESINKSEAEAQKILNALRSKYTTMYIFKDSLKKLALSKGYNETVLGRRRYYEGLGYKKRKLSRFEIVPKIPDEQILLDTLEKLKGKELKDFIKECKDSLGIVVKDRLSVSFAEERQTTNSVIQGSSADMTKLAMLSFFRDSRRKELGAEIVLQIHDEIIIEAPKENAEEAGRLLAEVMNGVGEELLGGLVKMGGEADIMDWWKKG